MKLRNKKTGEIVELLARPNFTKRDKENYFECEVVCFDSLAELSEEWEDYEEPKGYWCVDWTGGINHIIVLDDVDEYEENKKEIGNYFETKEEAELAVRKLKAWKRLKDVEFKLKGWYMPKNTLNIEIDGGFPEDVSLCDVMDDLDIIFGGEE